MVRIDNLSKRFSGKPALHPLDLEIKRGEIFGLLGHNGAGKSTTMGLMLGLLHPDTGEVFIGGHSVQKARRLAIQRVGAIFETPAFYGYLSGLRNLEMITAFTHPPERRAIEEVLELVGLRERIHDPVQSYSHGMRTRLALAQALLPEPEFILLDEPSDGLDPEGMHEMRQLILRLREEKGLTVMLSSHLLSEVEQICDRVAILRQGRMVFSGDWKSVKPTGRRFRLVADDWPRAMTLLEPHGVKTDSESFVIFPETCDPSGALEVLVRGGVRISEFSPCGMTLEEFYLERVCE
jgi:ABC-2 type transport system ATP-binding protein